MRITAVDQDKAVSKPLFIMTELSRKAVHTILGKLTIGSLVLEEQGQVIHFGNKSDTTVTASIQVKDPAAYLAVLKDGSTGAGEAYMLGQWE